MNEYYCVDTYLVKAIGKRLDAEQPVVEPTWREQFGPLAKRVEAIDRACETQCDDINAALQRIDALEARLREDGGDPPLAPAPEPEFGPDYDEQNTRYTYALARAEAAEAECLRLQNSVASFLERAHVSGRYESLMREKIRNVEAERDALREAIVGIPKWFGYKPEAWAECVESIKAKLRENAKQVVDLMHEVAALKAKVEAVRMTAEECAAWSYLSGIPGYAWSTKKLDDYLTRIGAMDCGIEEAGA